MPGFTHLQTAQPVTFGHHMLAWHEMLVRDSGRLQDCRKRVNIMPWGQPHWRVPPTPSIVRSPVPCWARCPTENSLDAVSDRDFAIEFCAFASLLMTHLSRFSEELILWTSSQFNFIDLPDRFCTGSSIMPQKKNPDVPELVRGKTGRVNGHLVSLLTLMKAQPLAYNKDNQEDKEPLFDVIDTLKGCLKAYGDIWYRRFKKENMYEAAAGLFNRDRPRHDYLVVRGVPFRDAHGLSAARRSGEGKKDLSEMSCKNCRPSQTIIQQDVFEVLTLEGSVQTEITSAALAPAQVRAAVQRARERLAPDVPANPSGIPIRE